MDLHLLHAQNRESHHVKNDSRRSTCFRCRCRYFSCSRQCGESTGRWKTPDQGSDVPARRSAPRPGLWAGMFLAPQILELADANADGPRSPKKPPKRRQSSFVRRMPKRRVRSMPRLGRAMNRRIGPPPGFGPGGPPNGPEGPPGGGPGGPGGGPPGGPGGPPGGPGGFGPGFLRPGSLKQPTPTTMADSRPRRPRRRPSGSSARPTPRRKARSKKTCWPAQSIAHGHLPVPAVLADRWVRSASWSSSSTRTPTVGSTNKNAWRLAISSKRTARDGRRGRPPASARRPASAAASKSRRPKPAFASTRLRSRYHRKTTLRSDRHAHALPRVSRTRTGNPNLPIFITPTSELPATLIVDGKKYPKVGVHFRGLSSFMMVREGHKRSLNVSLDFVDPTAAALRLQDAQLAQFARGPDVLAHGPVLANRPHLLPRTQGELRQGRDQRRKLGSLCERATIRQNLSGRIFPISKGTRWKVKGSPGGGGGLDYIGDNVEDYKRRYEIKTDDSPSAWKGLIELCKTLNQTPLDRSEES